MKIELAIVAAIGVATVGATQPPPPLREGARRPAFSPYLNLTRPGGGAAQNYYGLVRPELEFRNNVSQLRRDTQAIATGVATSYPAQDLETGHASGYMTHLRYFGTNGAAFSPSGIAAPTAAARVPIAGARMGSAGIGASRPPLRR